MLGIVLALALFVPGHGWTIDPGGVRTTNALACGRGWYDHIRVQDLPSGRYLRPRWNRDHDRLLYAGEHGWVHFDGVRVVNRTRHAIDVRGWCK